MELLNQFLANQITLPEFLEKSEGKLYRSSKEGIELITNGLKKAIDTFNESNTDNIQCVVENRDSIIEFNITYYKIKHIKGTYTTKEETIETIPFTSHIRFKVQAAKEHVILDNVKYNYIGSDLDGLKYYLKEVPLDVNMMDDEFVKKYHAKLTANILESLDTLYTIDQLTGSVKFEGHYSTFNRNVSYNTPLSNEEHYKLHEIMESYPVIESSIRITTNGTRGNRSILDYLKNENIANELPIVIRKMNEDLHEIFEK